ncbi:hypothetical protein HF086_006513 [Spodoptera exigua]|uniref:Uncharacterized protein n=1 Tax=Spodoptera exigua TaxID=7107 RepID=A0A922MKG4_SPOEX|nr:hypothetical protein HF086_006513 [Spodoptera exigua]
MEPPSRTKEPPVQHSALTSATPSTESPQQSLEENMMSANDMENSGNSQRPPTEMHASSENQDKEISQQAPDKKQTTNGIDGAEIPVQAPEELHTSAMEGRDNSQRPPDVVMTTSQIKDTEHPQKSPEEVITESSITDKENLLAPPDIVMTGNEMRDTDNITQLPEISTRNEIQGSEKLLTTNEQQSPECIYRRPEITLPAFDIQVATTSKARPEICAATASPRTPKRSRDQRPTSTKKELSTRAKIASILKAWKRGQRRRRARERMTKNLETFCMVRYYVSVRKMLGPGFWRDITVSDRNEAGGPGMQRSTPTCTATTARPHPPQIRATEYPQAHCSTTMSTSAAATTSEAIGIRATTSHTEIATTANKPSTTSAFEPKQGSPSDVIILDDDDSSDSDTIPIEEAIKHSPLAEMAAEMDAKDKVEARRKARENQNYDLQRELEKNKRMHEQVMKEMQQHLKTPVQTLGAAGLCGVFATPLPSLMEEDG